MMLHRLRPWSNFLTPVLGKHFRGDEEGNGWVSYSFHCPAEHLDAIYGNPNFPMGS
jgi:hypothetical protein